MPKFKPGDRVVTIKGKSTLTVSEYWTDWGFYAQESDISWQQDYQEYHRPLWNEKYFILESIYNSKLYKLLNEET